MPTQGTDNEKKEGKPRKRRSASSKAAKTGTKPRKVSARKSASESSVKGKSSNRASKRAARSNALPSWWPNLERAAVGMESVLSEAGQGALSAERGYVSYDAEPGFQEFPLEGALAEERESLQSDENHEDREDRMRSIEEELERLAMDEDEEEESEETQLLDKELSSGDRADELEAALWSGEDEPDQSAQHKPQRSSAIGKPLSSSETKARTLQEESEDEASRFLSELANEYELAQKTETDIDSDGSGDADEEAFADESSEEVSERDDSSTQYHDEPASEIKEKKPVPRNPFAQHQDTEEEFVAEQDVALQKDRGSFGSSSPARAMGGAASVGEAIVLMREDEGLTETEEAEQEITKPGVRRIDLAKNELQYGMLDLLQEDVHRLFLLGDVMGALVSLERVVLVAGDRPHVRSFLARNADKLMQLYEQVFGGFERVVTLVDDEVPLGPDIIGPVLLPNVKAAVDGSRTMREIMDTVDATEVEVATALHHMLRTRRVMFI